MPHTNPTNAVSLAMASCDGAVGIYALLLASAKASPRSRHHSETRLRLRIAETVALDPATQEVRAHFFTSSKSGCVMRKNRGSLQLDAVLHSMLRGLVCSSCLFVACMLVVQVECMHARARARVCVCMSCMD